MPAAGEVGGKRWAAARGAGKVGGQLEGAGRAGPEGEGEHSCSQRLVEEEEAAGKWELQGKEREREKGKTRGGGEREIKGGSEKE